MTEKDINKYAALVVDDIGGHLSETGGKPRETTLHACAAAGIRAAIAHDRASRERRERIATAAMQGLCANTSVIFGHHRCPEHPADCSGSIAEASVALASALIAELDKEAKKLHPAIAQGIVEAGDESEAFQAAVHAARKEAKP